MGGRDVTGNGFTPTVGLGTPSALGEMPRADVSTCVGCS